MKRNRREFLEHGGILLLLAGAASLAWEHVAAGEPEAAPGYDEKAHWWAMAIDIERCIGCGNCVRACKAENDVPLEPFYFRTWVERYAVPADDPEHPIAASPNGGYDGFSPAPAEEGVKRFYVPKLCNHCAHSPCVQVCPVGATFETRDGLVLVDKNYCLGCRYCVQACPYGCRFIDPRTRTVDKCTLCAHRLARGLTTACCETCPTGARRAGDLKDPKDPIHRFLAERPVHVLKPHLATGAKVYYAGLDGSVR
jgi:Fe-S-cluster-containing dehydrogenase component